MNKLSINIEIAGRKYPMKVNASEELKVRNAAKKINNRFEHISTIYRTRDAIDIMSIMLFELTMENDKANSACGTQTELLQKISDSLDNVIKESH